MPRKAQPPKPPPLNAKQKAFVERYLTCWNATEAARTAGYSHPRQQGWRLLSNVYIRAAVDARLAEMHMAADEVLARLSSMAGADMGDFLDAKTSETLDLKRARDAGRLHLVKKFATTDKVISIELHDAQAALVHLGRYHKLFTDIQEHTGQVQLIGLDKFLEKVYGTDDSDS
jgi:hypothetical protein